MADLKSEVDCEQTKTDIIRHHLAHTMQGIERPHPTYRGKVRDCIDNKKEIIIATTDRISAFDEILGTVPLKGALLTEQAAFWLKKAENVIKTHFIERIAPQVMVCHKARPLTFEIVVRGYLAGSLAREPAETRGHAYGLQIDPSIKEFSPFPAPIITPTTKAPVGQHDAPVTLKELAMPQVGEVALALFAMGTEFAKSRGLILVDTKYEFGFVDGQLVLIDELHTGDSSRYWQLDSYSERLKNGLPPEMLDKERLRRVLMTNQPLDDAMRIDLALHYWELTERLLGYPFVPPSGSAQITTENAIADYLRTSPDA